MLIRNYENYNITEEGSVVNLSTGTILAFGKSSGYYNVSLKNNEGRKTFLVHRLVAKAFVPNPEGKRTVNHIDGNKLNNHKNNVEWNTQSENQKHAYANGLQKKKLGLEHKASKKVLAIANDGIITEYTSLGDAGRTLGISRSNIHKAIIGKLKTYKNFIWKYA